MSEGAEAEVGVEAEVEAGVDRSGTGLMGFSVARKEAGAAFCGAAFVPFSVEAEGATGEG